jgi:hypothetical protein
MLSDLFLLPNFAHRCPLGPELQTRLWTHNLLYLLCMLLVRKLSAFLVADIWVCFHSSSQKCKRSKAFLEKPEKPGQTFLKQAFSRSRLSCH